MFPYLLYLTFTVSYFLRFPSRYPILADFRIDFVLSVIIFLGIVLTGRLHRLRHPNDKVTPRLLLLIGYIVITVPFVEWPGSVVRFGLEKLAKVVVFYFFTICLLDTEDRLKTFFYIFFGCQVFRIFEPIHLHVTTGYWGSSAYTRIGGESALLRLSGAPHDVINPNQLAWVILTTSIFLFYLLLTKRGVSGRCVRFALLATFGYGFVLTGSRSGFLTLLVLVPAMLYLSERRLNTALTIGLISLPLLLLLGRVLTPELAIRYLSLFDPTLPGGDTAAGRLHGLSSTLVTLANNPLLGNGLGTSQETNWNLSQSGQISHNLYIEIFQELGLVGFGLFFSFVFRTIRLLQLTRTRTRIPSRNEDFINRLATATQAWAIMNLFYGLASFGLTSWEWYLTGGLSVACARISRVTDPTGERTANTSLKSQPASVNGSCQQE